MSHAPTAALDRRHQAIRHDLASQSLDALVVTSLSNVLYLTNFTGSSAIAVVTAERLYFLTDFRYVTTLAESRGTASECPGLELVTVDGSYDATLADLLKRIPMRRVGFEAAHLTVARHAWLTHTVGDGPAHADGSRSTTPLQGSERSLSPTGPSPIDLVATEGIVERARVRKDDYEIATLREAARRLSAVAEAVPADVRPGRTEREVAMAIDRRLREAGFSRPAFDTIVAGGPNAALPHAQPGERRLRESDLVVLDFGGVYDSYCVDLTRTVVIGKASDRVTEVYGAVLEAHDRAIASVAPGRSRFDIDAAAREALTARGLGDVFGHGTGHGLGIDVHEDPRITRKRPGDERLDPSGRDVAAGMVFTIEPGAYLPGWGGVRIEDDVLVTEHGVELLTTVGVELIEI